jgi:lipopolysaccharide transport system permease protein
MLESNMDVTAPSVSSWRHKLSSSFEEGTRAFQNFLRHRDLLWQMVGNDLRGRYVGSFLGLFWNVVHPLVQIGIYTVIFSQVMGARLAGNTSPYSYSIYLCAGLLPWTVFVEIIQRCTGVFWENANLVKKIAFPKVLLHSYVVAAGALNLAIIVAIFLVFLWFIEALPPTLPLLVWGGFLLLQLLFAMGIGFFTSVLNVFFRDTAQLTSVLLQIWFWLTPIVYVVDIVPPAAAEWLQYNILYHFVAVHHALVLSGQLPTLEESLFLVQVSFVTLVLGLLCFRASRRRIPDEL